MRTYKEMCKEAAGMDISCWLVANDSICPYCGVDFNKVHPAYNIFPHWGGACKPAASGETKGGNK